MRNHEKVWETFAVRSIRANFCVWRERRGPRRRIVFGVGPLLISKARVKTKNLLRSLTGVPKNASFLGWDAAKKLFFFLSFNLSYLLDGKAAPFLADKFFGFLLFARTASLFGEDFADSRSHF